MRFPVLTKFEQPGERTGSLSRSVRRAQRARPAVILNAARLWTEFSSEQKQRLQKVLFPEGVSFESGEFRTAATCPLFKLLEQPEAEKSCLATLPGLEPGLPP